MNWYSTMGIKANYRMGLTCGFRYNYTFVHIVFILFFYLSVNITYAQVHAVIKGTVTDFKTGELLSFVSVSIKNHNLGVQTNQSGKFEFKVKIKPGDSLRISYVGYALQIIPLSNKSIQTFDIKLQEETYELGEVIVTADPNPGKALMKKVIRQNANNNLANLNRFHAKRWELKEVDIHDPNSEKTNLAKEILFGDKAKMFASLRSKDDSLKMETPLFLSEKIAEYELTRIPFSESEKIIAIKTTGFETDRLLEPLVKWNAGDINLYSDWVLLFNKTFVSPVGQDAFNYYNFYIIDSVALPGGHNNITFQAIPKDWKDNVFSGYFTVNDSSFALIAADLRLSKSANINFVEAIRIQQQYVPSLDLSTGTHRYALSESTLSLQYLANLESLGIPLPISLGDLILMCKMKVKNSSILLNGPEAAQFAKTGALVNSKMLMDTGHDDDFWSKQRPDTISYREASIYLMAEKLNQDFKAKAKEQLLAAGLSGYYNQNNNYYIGPLGSLISYNVIEGIRLRLSARTMEGVFLKTGIFGHVAYGFKDNKVKTNLGFRKLWQTQPYSRSQLFISSDYDVIIEWFDQSDKDNIINSLLRKRLVPYNRVFNKQLALTHDQQIGANVQLHFGINYQTLNPSFSFSYPNPAFQSSDLTPDEPINRHIVSMSELILGLRFGWHESAKIFNYTRYPLASKYPVFVISYTHGLKIDKSDFRYQKWSLNLNHTSHLTPKIEFIWDLEFGKIFGTIPSLILHQPSGSDTWVMSHRVFNLMTPYEFSSNSYAELLSRFNLGGIFFDRIPLINKLLLRERIIINSFWGSLSAANKQFDQAQNTSVAMRDPYFELGFGIDNIFHVFSVNYIKRINYLDSPGAKGNHNGIFIGMKVIY